MLDFKFFADAFPKVVEAIPVTLEITFISALTGWILGIIIALVRKYKVPVLSQLFAVFISFMRGVPAIILLYISFYALPALLFRYGQSVGTSIDVAKIPPILYAVITLILEQAAFSSEVFRSSIGAVDEGQIEAANSIGMTRFQGLVRIVFPQAFVVAFPNLGGMFVGLLHASSLVYYVGVVEITATATLLAQPAYAFLEAYFITTIIYETLSFIFSKIFRATETRLKRYKTGVPIKRDARKEYGHG